MYHTIEFLIELTLDLEVSPKQWLQMLHLDRGTRLCVQLKPYVVDTEEYGLVEVADLFIDDGTVARAVAYDCFHFVDE